VYLSGDVACAAPVVHRLPQASSAHDNRVVYIVTANGGAVLSDQCCGDLYLYLVLMLDGM